MKPIKTTIETSILSNALLFAFIILKVTGLTNMSWLWVFSPLWIRIGMGILMILPAIVYKIFHKNRP